MIAGAGSAAAGIAVGILIVLAISVWIGIVVLWIMAIVDIAKRPEWQFKLAGQEKLLWLLLTIFVSVVAIIYWFAIRSKLIAVEQAAASGAFGPGHMTLSGWQPGPVPLARPGWYPDPGGLSHIRYWDGAQWTEHVNPPGATGHTPV